MRYRFAGLRRDSGQPVKGHVEAETTDDAYDVLGRNGIVVETLDPDPEWTDDSGRPAIASAIDQALDASAKQIPFDSLRDRFRGKRVWVIDREKIKRRVIKTVDEVVRRSERQTAGDADTRDRITEALDRLFSDNRNLTSPVSAAQEALEGQINRLAVVVRELEHAVGAVRAATRWSPAGRDTLGVAPRREHDEAREEVLRAIFETNLELRKRR